ncbi:hypothetical protein C0992_012474, partial [Termitomyces sp. T32_za158]
MDGIPPLQSFAPLRDEVSRSWKSGSMGTFNFQDLADRVLDIDIEVCHCQASAQFCTSKTHSKSTLNPALSTSSNNNATGNSTDSTPVRRFNNDNSKDSMPRHKANVAVPDPITELIPLPPPFVPEEHSPTSLPTVVEEDNDIVFSAYADTSSDSPLSPFQAFVSSVDMALLSDIHLKFNSILDSGCTTHLIKDRDLFWTYDTGSVVPVGTANCGTLEMLARGEVRFHVHVEGKSVIFRLLDCLHAPDIPINLLSVGTMVANDMKLLFEHE